MRKTLFFYILFVSAVAHADEYIPNKSPFYWAATIINTDEKSRMDPGDAKHSYSQSEFANLLEGDISNSKLDTKCHLKFAKGISDHPVPGFEGAYDEQLWISCSVKGIQFSMNAIACTYNPKNPNDHLDRSGVNFEAGKETLSIDIFCSPKEGFYKKKI